MDRAIQIGFGQSDLVTALDVKKRFHGREPSNLRFLCPFCRRPVIPVSMNDWNVVVPHFKHQRNDPIAQECEAFEKANGYGVVYKRVPLPMFIRPSRERSGVFIIEVGMRPIGLEHIDSFEKSNAKLWVEDKQYYIARARFCRGTFRARIEQLSMKPSAQVRAENLPKAYERYWGSIEDPIRAMVFTCDPVDEDGYRLKTGDCVSVGTAFYLVATESEIKIAEKRLSKTRRAGRTSRRGKTLYVLKAEVPPKGQDRERAENYLASCGFGVVDYDPTPVAVWPPALQNSGDIIPLFGDSPSVFIAPIDESRAAPGSWLYQHSDEDRGGEPRKFPLQRAKGANHGLCVMKRTRLFCYVGARNGAFATAALVRDMDLEALTPTNCCEQSIAVEITRNSREQHIRIASPIPASVKRMIPGRPNMPISPDAESGLFYSRIEPREAVIIETMQPAFPTARIICWFTNEAGSAPSGEAPEAFPRLKAFNSIGADIAFVRLGFQPNEANARNESGGYTAALSRARRHQ